MNVEHLKLFVRLAITCNISQAGFDLGLSPAVASSYISKLEEGLGVRLVYRTTRRVSLTEEGMAFLPYAEEVLSSIEAARSSIGLGQSLPVGTLRITAPASFGRMHLIPALEGFMAAYPDIKVDCRLSDAIFDLVEGGFDVAIRNAELKNSSLVARKLTNDERVLCTSPQYIEKYGIPTCPKDLLNHKTVLLTGFEHWTFETPNGAMTIKPHGHLRVDNGEAVRDACVHGLGITTSSKWCIYKHLASGELVQILDNYPIISDTAIWAVYPSSRLLAPKVRRFIDYFADYFGEIPDWDK